MNFFAGGVPCVCLRENIPVRKNDNFHLDFFFITISNSVLIFSAFINRCSYSSVHSSSKFSQFAKLKLVKSLYDSVLRPNCEHLMVFPFHAIFCFSIFVLLYICIYFFNIKHICVVNSIALCSYDFRNKD